MIRRSRIALAASVLLALAACRSPERRAAIADARFDQYYAAGDFQRARVEARNAIRADEDVPLYWQKLARTELLLGNPSGAFAAYSRVVELQRDNVEALEWLVQLAIAGRDDPDARRYLDSLTVLQPNNIRGRLAQGTLALRDQHTDEALKIADGVLADAPTVNDAAILKARVYDQLKQPENAIAALEAQIAKAGPSVPLLQQLLGFYEQTDNEAGIRNTYVRLFRLQPTNVDLQLEFARVLYSRGKPGEAARIADEVRAKHPGDVDTQLKVIAFDRDTAGQAVAMSELTRMAATGDPKLKVALAGYLLEDNEPASARRLVEPLVAGKPVEADTVEAQLIYAGALKDLGETGKARALLDDILDFDKTNSRALLLRTEIEVKAHKLDDALKDVRILVRDNPDFEPGLLMLGDVYAARGQQELARDTFQSATNDNPASPLTLRAYTDYMIRRGDLQGALGVAAVFAKTNPKSVAGWSRMGELCVQAGDEGCVRNALLALAGLPDGAPAARALTAALETQRAAGRILPPTMALAINQVMSGQVSLPNLGSALVAAHRGALAQRLVAELIRRQPNNSLFRVVQADLFILGGDATRGRAMLKQVIATDPKQVHAYTDLAFSQHRAGDDSAAMATMIAGLRNVPGNIDLLNATAGLQIQTGQMEHAIATLRRIVQIVPNNLYAVNNLASLLADYGASPAERAEAVRIAQPLVREDLPTFNDTRGWAAFRAGDAAGALPILRHAVAQSPDTPVFGYHLGAVLMATGDRAAGQKLIESALARADRKDKWLEAARALLDRS